MPTGSDVPPRATRRDVARRAEVSVAVVSFVVNGSKRVSPATEARVREAVEALGYRADPVARALSTGSSHLLGLVVPDLTNPFFAEMSERIELAARERGFSLIVTNSLSDPAVERSNTADLEDRRVDATIIATVLAPGEIRVRGERRVKEVFLENSDTVMDAATVGTDLAAGAVVAVRHLLDHGHATVGILGGDVDDPERIDARVSAWRRTLAQAGAPEGPIIRSDFSRRGAWRAVHAAAAAGTLPTALFATSDLQAVGALRALAELGIRVPDDLALVGFDGIEEGEFSVPSLTTVRQPIDLIAAALVEAAISDPDEPIRRSFAPELVIRRSCGCEPRA